MNRLAIHGGKPISPFQQRRPSPIQDEELEAATGVIKSGILSRAGRGQYVRLFEKEFAEWHGVRYAVSTTSGTTALHTAVCALDIRAGDEVLVPSLTFISSASVILQQNAKPVFVDIDPQTFCLDPDDLQRKITRKSKAVIVVHLYGRPAEMDRIMEIARGRRLRVIEDCAQAHGARYKNRLVGTFGDLACFSFYQTKNMTCGEGGMVITDNKDLYEVCFSVADHGLVAGNLENYNYDRLGYNYHMTEIQAAIGLVQLTKLESMNIQRRENARLYKRLLEGTSLVFQDDSDNVYHVYYSLTALLPKKFKDNRDWFVEAVRRENVEINRLYPIPLHKAVLFEEMSLPYKCPVAEEIAGRLFNFYTNPGISEEYVELTCKAARKVLSYMERYGK